jgi:dihydrolipoamide dehydrogenase
MAGSYDVAFLGGGMGGYVGAIRAAQLGLRTAVVEEDKLGGTCLHRGCIPTKALLQSAFVLDQARQGGRLGVRVSGVELDYAQVARNRDQIVGQLHRGVEYLMKKNRIEVVRGRGRLEGPRRVRVGGGQSGDADVEAGSIVIATGSRPKQVPGAEADGRVVLTSDHALALDHVPASAIVLGAGAVGVEFASFWRSCEVTVVEMLDRLVPLEDRAIGVELAKHFEARGIRCLVGATLDLGSIRRGEEGVEVSVTHGGAEERLRSEVLLIAIGRTPNTEEIGLESTAVELERGFVRAGPDLRTA